MRKPWTRLFRCSGAQALGRLCLDDEQWPGLHEIQVSGGTGRVDLGKSVPQVPAQMPMPIPQGPTCRKQGPYNR